MKKAVLIAVSLMFLVFCYAGPAAANKSATAIDGPTSAEKGAEVVIKVTVTHSANSFFHYTKSLKVQANGKTVAEWEFSNSNRPEEATFTKEVKIIVDGDMNVVAEASCNIHGSAGPAKLTIKANQ